MTKIVFTGGGTAGHVTLNKILIPFFHQEGYEIHYIGSNGIEKDIISQIDYVTYHTVSTGKLRRYIDKENLIDISRVIKGTFQSYKLLRKIDPDVIFSKGGFVSVPVVVGAGLNHMPVYIHESDITMGLANKIASRFATKVWSTFSLEHPKSERIGAILDVNQEENLNVKPESFDPHLPTLLFIGGSQGAKVLNEFVYQNKNELTTKYNIFLVAGQGETVLEKNFCAVPYIHENLFAYYNMADFVITRGGANSLFELLSLQKKMIIVPLGLSASRGDQIANANYFAENGYGTVIQEEDFTLPTLEAILLQPNQYFNDAKIKQGAETEIMSAKDFYIMFMDEIEKSEDKILI